MMQPGATVKLNVVRSETSASLFVKLSQLPTRDEDGQVKNNGSENASEGVTVDNLDAQTAQEFDLRASPAGVVVTDFSPSNPYADSGLATSPSSW